jgi:putative cardiolipin synthase
MKYRKIFKIAALAATLYGCAGIPQQQCPPGTLQMQDCPPADAVEDEAINDLYESRTWLPASERTVDPVELAAEGHIPINHARVKTIGPAYDKAVSSLAAKLWLIENAQHTVDATYFIFALDHAGYAVLGAMCNAVKRGVDVRIMVDSLGSMRLLHSELRALETCADEAGIMRNANGQITTKKARAQVVIFNAFTKLQFNRRSHDKLLIVDGSFPDKAVVMTGGRNISLDYYGINEDGSKDPTAFRDMEIIIRPGERSADEEYTVGNVTEIYYSLLFAFHGNRRIWPYEADDEFSEGKYEDVYITERKKSQESLAFLKSLPDIKKHMDAMPRFMREGFHDSKVRLAHQLSNLTNIDVTTNVEENLERNPNSILYTLFKITEESRKRGITSGTLRIVSPYLFIGKYYNDDGEVVYDGAKRLHDYLRDRPGIRVEIITNSVMTSDNFFTQAVIDMDMAPRMLLTPELQKTWASSLEDSELNPDVVESDEWKRMINHPQIFIYQTGGLDSVYLGGDVVYGKLHAKFIVGDRLGFIGTSNFDYRSNLYNNEMGFFYQSDGAHQEFVDVFNELKATSYRWGTPEWLIMRRELMDGDSKKSGPARKQRTLFQNMRGLGIEYLM